MTIPDEVRSVVREELGLDITLPLPDDRPLYSLGADSLDAVSVMMGLEKQFEIDLDLSVLESTPQSKHTIGWLIGLVEEGLLA